MLQMNMLTANLLPCCLQVYEGQWRGQTVAIKVLDGAAATSQKAMREVSLTPFTDDC